MKQQKTNLTTFEALSETKTGALIGGFSSAYTSSKPLGAIDFNGYKCTITNNCNGGNCTVGCGSGGTL